MVTNPEGERTISIAPVTGFAIGLEAALSDGVGKTIRIGEWPGLGCGWAGTKRVG